LVLTPKLELKRRLSQFQIQVGKARIPRVLLGTSPFIGAGQFGSRAEKYYKKFQHVENIVKVVRVAVDFGVLGVQVLPSPKVFEAISWVEAEVKDKLTIVGTVGLHDAVEEIKRFSEFKTVALLIHGNITDRKNTKLVSELLNQIHASNRLAGLVSHRPYATLKWLQKTDLTADVDLLMLPFNKLGMFMDAEPAVLAHEILHLNKPVIGKKTLAAGYLTPRDAFRFIAENKCITMVAVGVASVEEAKETFAAAASLLCKEESGSKP